MSLSLYRLQELLDIKQAELNAMLKQETKKVPPRDDALVTAVSLFSRACMH